MNMTEKNGQPSMEEILASIRRIIAEEPASHPHNGELRGTPIIVKGDGALDDIGEFDLPAIFRSSPPPATERSTPLLGRLTDAIRSATTPQTETRSSMSNDDYAQAELAEATAGAADDGMPGLSSLTPARHEPRSEPAPVEPLRPVNGTPVGKEPIQPASSPSSSAFPAMASSGKPGEPKRVMAPFKDTHFMRMTPAPADSTARPSEVPAPAAPAPAAAPPPYSDTTSSVDFSNIIPGQFDRNSLMNGAHVNGARSQFGAADPTAPPAPHVAPIAMPPPPIPMAEPMQNALMVVPPGGNEEPGTIEDTTADLLRPMLRQWLADNMPRMVEKALHIEIAESIKAPKKP